MHVSVLDRDSQLHSINSNFFFHVILRQYHSTCRVHAYSSNVPIIANNINIMLAFFHVNVFVTVQDLHYRGEPKLRTVSKLFVCACVYVCERVCHRDTSGHSNGNRRGPLCCLFPFQAVCLLPPP